MKTHPGTALARVQSWSRAFQWFARALIAGMILTTLATSSLRSVLAGGIELQQLLRSSLLFNLMWILGAGILERIFAQFAQGRVFTPATARWLKRFGIWLVLFTLVTYSLSVPSASSDSAHLGWIILLQLFGPSTATVVTGIFLIMLGWVLEEATVLKQEQDLTV